MRKRLIGATCLRQWLLTGNDITGMRYTFVRVVPVATKDESDFVIGRDQPLYYEIASIEPLTA